MDPGLAAHHAASAARCEASGARGSCYGVLPAGRPFRKARQILPFGEPWHIMQGPDVHGRPDRRIIVEGGDAKHDMRLIGAFGDDVGAAPGTEPPHPAGRRFEGDKLFSARDQMKMISHDARRGRVWRRVRFATGLAVTMTDRCVEAVDLIAHRSAQAASFQCHGFPPLQCPAADARPVTASSVGRSPSRSAAAAAARSPATRTPAALPAPGREIVARCRAAACRPYRMRARPRRRRFQ
jgi:hypothetical protein